MLTNYITVPAKGNRRIKLNIYPGHYATSHAHVDNYFSMTEMRTDCVMAEEAASELVKQFRYTPVDTVISLEYTQIISAFVAKELSTTQSIPTSLYRFILPRSRRWANAWHSSR